MVKIIRIKKEIKILMIKNNQNRKDKEYYNNNFKIELNNLNKDNKLIFLQYFHYSLLKNPKKICHKE